MWGFRENSSRKLTPLEVLSICPSPFLPSYCLGPCHPRHVRASLDFFYIKKLHSCLCAHYLDFLLYAVISTPPCYSGVNSYLEKNKGSQRTLNSKLGWQRKPANISELGFYVLLFKIINADIYATEGENAIISSINSTELWQVISLRRCLTQAP